MEVKVYSSLQCPWCETTKNFLRAHIIPFEDIDASANNKIADEMIKKSGQMEVPVTEIDRKLIVGFNKEALHKALGLQKDA